MSESLRLLVVEDQPLVRRNVVQNLTSWGHDVQAAEDCASARALLAGGTFDVIFLDLGLPDGDGLEVLESLPVSTSRPRIVVMTGDATQDTAVKALRLGADDFILKPFSSRAIASAIERLRPSTPPPAPVARRPSDGPLSGWRARFLPELVGEHPALLTALDTAARVADSDCSVLVLGETGTGKELIARSLHRASPRRDRPFIALNCAAMPESLIESELFGAVRGAYTGAVAAREGRFTAANGGTLFLDEIAEMPLAVQAKLLRAIQEREVTPVGATRPVSVDVRFVAATHADLDSLVETNRFRADLLYRLDVVRVELPPLRRRHSDLALLVPTLVATAAARLKRPVPTVSSEAMSALASRSWPGNVRQLEHALESAIVRARGTTITVEDLPSKTRPVEEADPIKLPEEGVDLKSVLDRVEETLLRQALERTKGNRTKAAELLGVNRTTLIEKLKKRGMSPA